MHYNILNHEEISALKENLEPVFSKQLYPTLIKLNLNGRLEQFLNLIEMGHLINPDDTGYVSLPDKNILLLGDSELKDEHIYKTLGELGISKDRVELHTEYEQKKINIDTLKYSSNYSLILLGPVPHSMKGKGQYESGISRLEQESGFPPVKRLTVNGNLKITKTSLMRAIKEAVHQEQFMVF